MRKIIDNTYGSAIPIFAYIAANAVFGLVWWFLNGIFVEMKYVSETGDTFAFGIWIWDAIIVVFVLGSSFWVIRQYSKKSYRWG